MATDMGVIWNRRRPLKGTTGRPRHRRQLEITPLEERRLMSIGTVTAVATPRILPDNGKLVPVTVTGSIQQVIVTNLGHATVAPPASQLAAIDAANEAKPGPKEVLGVVTDQYGADEPRVRTTALQFTTRFTFFAPFSATNPTAVEGLIRNYTYTITLPLQARSHSISRQYDIGVFASDSDTVGQKNIAVLVPAHGAHPKNVAHFSNLRGQLKGSSAAKR
jgi:hypothetical protein